MPGTSFHVRMLCGVLGLLTASSIATVQPSTKQLTQIFLGSLGAYYAFEVFVWPRVYNSWVKWDNKDKEGFGNTFVKWDSEKKPLKKAAEHSFPGEPNDNAVRALYESIHNAQEKRFSNMTPSDEPDKALLAERQGKKVAIKGEAKPQSFTLFEVSPDYKNHLANAGANVPRTFFKKYKKFYHSIQDSFGKLGNKPAPTLTTQTETAHALYSLAALVQAFPTICHSIIGLGVFGRALPIELWAWEGGRHCLDALVTLFTYCTTKEKSQELVLPLAAGLGIGYGAQKILDEIDLQRFGKSVLIVPRILPGVAFVNDISGEFPATKELGSQVVSDNLVQDTIRVMTWLQIGKGMMKHIHYTK